MRHRSDGNQTEIIDALMRMGVSVQNLSQVGCGCPDLLLSVVGRTYVAEVKCGPDWKLRESQKKWHTRWNAPVLIFESVQQATDWVNHTRRTERTEWHQS